MFGMSNIKEIGVDELNQKLSDSPDTFKLIDVRTPAEFARANLEGAENIPLHIIPIRIEEFDPDKEYVIYCQTGARSAQACAFMASKGVANVYNVRGGIVSWAQMGYPIVM